MCIATASKRKRLRMEGPATPVEHPRLLSQLQCSAGTTGLESDGAGIRRGWDQTGLGSSVTGSHSGHTHTQTCHAHTNEVLRRSSQLTLCSLSVGGRWGWSLAGKGKQQGTKGSDPCRAAVWAVATGCAAEAPAHLVPDERRRGVGRRWMVCWVWGV